MMEQLDLFSTIPTEEWAFEVILPTLQARLAQSNAGPDNIKMERGKEYSSVSYLSQDPYDSSKPKKKQLAFRICCRDDLHYFGISSTFASLISPEFMEQTVNNTKNDGFINLVFAPTEDGIMKYVDLLASILDSVTYSLLKEFDCCSRFEQCSNAGKCVHPYPGMATGCGYRKILKSGKVFYGEKRNID